MGIGNWESVIGNWESEADWCHFECCEWQFFSKNLHDSQLLIHSRNIQASLETTIQCHL
ncbi:hypothetical protein BGP_1911 [Beggiatoa sp. PS]|nr:hypothetical protein BGP_1911 [Beggiatoa sp. PS]